MLSIKSIYKNLRYLILFVFISAMYLCFLQAPNFTSVLRFFNLKSIDAEIIIFRPKCDCKKDKLVELKQIEDNLFSVSLINKNVKTNLYNLTKTELDGLTATCDWYNVLLRGKHQKTISFALYGKNRFYYDKLKDVTIQMKQLYPEWFMRVYYDDSVDMSFICEIECQKDTQTDLMIDNSDFCNINRINLSISSQRLFNASYIHAMKWRYFPLNDSFVDIASFRDSDSYIWEREVDSVNEWLQSDKIAHIMRDNPQHGTAILGGMWGFKSKDNRKLGAQIFSLILNPLVASRYNPTGKSPKGYDQFFLADHVFGLVKSSSVIHDSFLCKSYGGSPWPTKRKGNCFVGSTLGCNQSATFYQCPIECRPKDHQDWVSC